MINAASGVYLRSSTQVVSNSLKAASIKAVPKKSVVVFQKTDKTLPQGRPIATTGLQSKYHMHWVYLFELI